ncbi:MAG: F0F1 ATP synthase subunit B [Myxococcaceae bacterium]|nr:F0F1 ATP synthase subunit B [Myxococcaceae bacterium]
MHLTLLAASLTEIRPALIFWTLITFGIVALVLRWKAWGPVLALVDEREKQIQNAVDAAKRERAEAEKLLAEQKNAIAEARREAAEMMRKAQADMDRFREELKSQASREAAELKAQAAREIEEQKKKAVAEVRAMAANLAIDVAAQLIGERLDESKHRALAEQYIDQLAANKPLQRPPAS